MVRCSDPSAAEKSIRMRLRGYRGEAFTGTHGVCWSGNTCSNINGLPVV